MNINLLKFQIVELLEKNKKITSVAEQLGLKQPTVSFHMKSLEKELGVKLFESRMGNIVFTEAGRALYHYAVKINALAAEAGRVVAEFEKLERGSLRIGASYVPATYILPSVLSEFADKHPGVNISLSVKPSPVIKEMLLHHEIDLGILVTEPFKPSSLVVEPIGEDELVFICSPHHRLAMESELTPALISTCNFAMHGKESSTRQLVDRWMEQKGIPLRGFIELDSLEAIKQAVMKSNQISFLSALSVEDEVKRGLLLAKPIPEFTYRRLIYCAYNRDRHNSGLMHLLKDQIRSGMSGS